MSAPADLLKGVLRPPRLPLTGPLVLCGIQEGKAEQRKKGRTERFIIFLEIMHLRAKRDCQIPQTIGKNMPSYILLSV